MKVALLPIYPSCEESDSFMKLDMVRRVGKMHPQGMLPNRPASTKRRNQRNRDNKDSCILQTLTGANMGECLLSTVGNWTFNIFNLDKLTNGRSLFHISLHIFQEHNLIQTFNLDIVKLMRCVSLIEDSYHNSNPYHNAVHAADVTQAMHCFLKENKLAQHLTPLEKLTAILSAILHDVDHPGVNQAFLIATSNPLATLYAKTSVLENHHWRAAIGLLLESGVFDHFETTTWNRIEWQLKSLILATDITRQQEYLCKFKTLNENDDLDMRKAEHRHFMMQIALKCADICNPCRPWEVSRRWSQHVCDEFFKQGDCERQLQLPVTPLCDRYGTSIAKIQSGFMQYVVRPLFVEWYRFSPTRQSRTLLDNIDINKIKWDEIIAEETSEDEEEEERLEPLDEEEQSSETTAADGLSEDSKSETDESKENENPEELLSDDDDQIPLAPLPEQCSSPVVFPCRRRHSMPTQIAVRHLMLPRRCCNAQSRRHSLPHANILESIKMTSSFDRLCEKLSSVLEQLPQNGSRLCEYERLQPKLTSLSMSTDESCLECFQLEASKQTNAHGLVPSGSQRPYVSEPYIAADCDATPLLLKITSDRLSESWPLNGTATTQTFRPSICVSLGTHSNGMLKTGVSGNVCDMSRMPTANAVSSQVLRPVNHKCGALSNNVQANCLDRTIVENTTDCCCNTKLRNSVTDLDSTVPGHNKVIGPVL
ncbi:High affinity cAMP-specific 3',5'-cyclic phosphodiesterase 7A [Lamellibrachia satsuma]|nr:High affinity cAMP-specific 3',5'-cyclic phosphodiesterase 7A [Lamellibrachia satsuma]